MTQVYREINVFDVWGPERVLAVAAEVIRNRRKLEVLAEIRMKSKPEIDCAAETIKDIADRKERARYAAELPLSFQTIIILDCLREFNQLISGSNK